MHRRIHLLSLILLGSAHATPLPALMQRVEEQPAVKSALLQVQQTRLKLSAPGVMPTLSLDGSVGTGHSALTGNTDTSSSAGAGVAYGFISSGQQKSQIELEVQKLEADLNRARIATLKDLLAAEHAQRKNTVLVKQAELDLRIQQLELKTREARFALGASTATQVSQSQLMVKKAELTLKQQQAALRKSVQELQRLKLADPQTLPELPIPPLDQPSFTSEVLQAQQNVLQLQLQGFKLGMEAFPELQFSGSYSNAGNTLSAGINQNLDAQLNYSRDFQGNAQDSWNLKLSAKFTLDPTRGAAQAINQNQLELALQDLSLKQQQWAERKTDLQQQLQDTLNLIEVSRQVQDLSLTTFKQEQERFKQGLVTEASVLQAESQFLKEEQNLQDLFQQQFELQLQLWEASTWYPQNGK